MFWNVVALSKFSRLSWVTEILLLRVKIHPLPCVHCMANPWSRMAWWVLRMSRLRRCRLHLCLHPPRYSPHMNFRTKWVTHQWRTNSQKALLLRQSYPACSAPPHMGMLLRLRPTPLLRPRADWIPMANQPSVHERCHLPMLFLISHRVLPKRRLFVQASHITIRGVQGSCRPKSSRSRTSWMFPDTNVLLPSPSLLQRPLLLRQEWQRRQLWGKGSSLHQKWSDRYPPPVPIIARHLKVCPVTNDEKASQFWVPDRRPWVRGWTKVQPCVRRRTKHLLPPINVCF